VGRCRIAPVCRLVLERLRCVSVGNPDSIFCPHLVCLTDLGLLCFQPLHLVLKFLHLLLQFIHLTLQALLDLGFLSFELACVPLPLVALSPELLVGFRTTLVHTTAICCREVVGHNGSADDGSQRRARLLKSTASRSKGAVGGVLKQLVLRKPPASRVPVSRLLVRRYHVLKALAATPHLLPAIVRLLAASSCTLPSPFLVPQHWHGGGDMMQTREASIFLAASQLFTCQYTVVTRSGI